MPKGRFAFDDLDKRDFACVMSHLNSEPRPSLGGLCAIDLFCAQYGKRAEALLDGLGIERIAYDRLNLTEGLLDAERASRGLPPMKRA